MNETGSKYSGGGATNGAGIFAINSTIWVDKTEFLNNIGTTGGAIFS